MFGLGTIINVAAIIIGGLMGLLFGNRMSESMQESLGRVNGVGVLFLGISGAMQGMLEIKDASVQSRNGMMVVISLALGTFIGELLNIERMFETIGEKLRDRFAGEGDNLFIDGFLSASLTVCIGAMVITGAIADGVYGDISIYTTKGILDFVTVMVLTCTYGKGCMFSALPCAVIQGGFTLAARLIAPYLTDAALASVSMVGSVLIFCVGLNLVWGKHLKVANMIPAILIAVAISYFQ